MPAYNLNFVVAMVKADLDDFSTSQDMKLLNLALHGYRSELRLMSDTKVDYAYLEINEVGQAALPLDYARYTTIGVICNGRIVTLTWDEDLALQNRYDECGCPTTEDVSCVTCSQENGDWGYGFWYAPHYRNGNFVGESYGQTGGKNHRGYFKIFKDQGVIQFDINFPRMTVILGYVSDGSANDGMTIIGLPAVEPLRKYVHWQKVAYGNAPSLSFVQMRKDEYFFSISQYRHLLYCPTVSEFLDASYAAYKSSPKR